MTSAMHVLQGRPLFESVHRCPKTIKAHRPELASSRSADATVHHEVLILVEIIEDLLPEDEVATVDSHVHVRDRLDAGKAAVAIDSYHVE
jgi:hypothetical protein